MLHLDPYQEAVTFQGVELRDEELSGIEFMDCTFEHCTLEGCILNRCTFTDCTFVDCRLSNLTSEHSTVNDTDFVSCHLSGFTWKDWMFSGGYLSPIHRLQDCQLKYNNFEEMNFIKFDFSGSAITASMFAGCNLSESKFYGCQLERTEFYKCDLTKADFRRATGYAVDLSTTKLDGAKFSFPEVVNLLDGLNIVIE